MPEQFTKSEPAGLAGRRICRRAERLNGSKVIIKWNFITLLRSRVSGFLESGFIFYGLKDGKIFLIFSI
jgi:hypothetical protein